MIPYLIALALGGLVGYLEDEHKEKKRIKARDEAKLPDNEVGMMITEPSGANEYYTFKFGSKEKAERFYRSILKSHKVSAGYVFKHYYSGNDETWNDFSFGEKKGTWEVNNLWWMDNEHEFEH